MVAHIVTDGANVNTTLACYGQATKTTIRTHGEKSHDLCYWPENQQL